jgi:hypothetical protein
LQHLVRVRVALDLDDDAHAVAVARREVGDPSIFLRLDEVGDLLESVALLTWYGSSVTTIAMRPARISSNATWARMTTRPRPCGVHLADRVDRSFSPVIGLRWSRSGRSCRRSGSPGR